MLSNILKNKHFILSLVSFSLTFLLVFICFIVGSVQTEFNVGGLVWLFIILPLFALGVFGIYRKNKTMVLVSTIIALSFYTFNSLTSSSSSFQLIESLLKITGEWPLAVGIIIYFFGGLFLTSCLILFILVSFFNKKELYKYFEISFLGALVAFALYNIFIFILCGINKGSSSAIDIMNSLSILILVFGLGVNVDYLVAE